MRHTHVIGLDAIRIAAVGLVMSYHFLFWNWLPIGSLGMLLGPHGPSWGLSLHFGWVGVEVFFVISGYVIAYSSADAAPVAFLQNRVIRLAPANWIGATLVLLCLWGAGSGTLSGYMPRYLETLVFWPLNSIDGVWWTLGIEIMFYGLVYILMAAGRRARLESVMVAWSAASLLFWIAALGISYLLADASDPHLMLFLTLVVRAEGNRELQLLLVQHAAFFAAGVIAFNASRHGWTKARAGALAIIVPACLLEIVAQDGIISRASHLQLSPVPALLAWLAGMGLLAAAIRFNGRLSALAGGRLRPLRFAGVATYPMYLVHDGVGVLLIACLFPAIGLAAIPAAMAGATAVALFVAWLPEPAVRSLVLLAWPRIDPRGDPVAHATLPALDHGAGDVADRARGPTAFR